MNLNQIINMIVRQVMRRLISRGVNSGMDMAERGARNALGRPRNQNTEEEDQQPPRT